jgi:hypothetical protein
VSSEPYLRSSEDDASGQLLFDHLGHVVVGNLDVASHIALHVGELSFERVLEEVLLQIQRG